MAMLRKATGAVAGDIQGIAAVHAYVRLSPTAFSEVLRSLDPTKEQLRLDDAHTININQKMADLTPLGFLVDTFGVRRVYTTLLEGLLLICRKRNDAGLAPLLSDYKVLLRCAGAASDSGMAKRIWQAMDLQRQRDGRDGGSYHDFLKSRFLTDPLYAQHDTGRFRLRPINVHRQQSAGVPPRILRRLKWLRRKQVSRRLMLFGHDRIAAHGRLPDYSHTTSILKKRKPIRRIFAGLWARGLAPEESLLSSAIVALGWSAQLDFIKREILGRFWQIEISTEKQTGIVTVHGPGPAELPYRRDSPLYPTSSLIHAVAQSFCSNGKVATAVKLVDFISQRWEVQVPDRIWFDILAWTDIMASRPATEEWDLMAEFLPQWPRRSLSTTAVLLVWETMLAKPYNAKPGFAQYDILIRALIEQRRFEEALKHMRRWQQAYISKLTATENAFYEYAQARRLDARSTRSFQRLLRARAQKSYMWYRISVWCYSYIRGQRHSQEHGVHDMLIPRLVEEFRPFLHQRVEYRVPAGEVLLDDIAAPLRYREELGSVRLPHVAQKYVQALRPQAMYLPGREPPPDPPKGLAERKRTLRMLIRQGFASSFDLTGPGSTGRMRTIDLQREFT
jgi:hypothetical protein